MPSPTVFISHAHTDGPFVRRLSDDLQNNGIHVWMDQQEFAPGELIAEKIIEGMERSDAVLVVLSKAASDSKWVSSEAAMAMGVAKGTGKPLVVPILTDKDIRPPGLLAMLQWLDFSDEKNRRAALDRLIRAIYEAHFAAPKPAGPERAARKLITGAEQLAELEKIEYDRRRKLTRQVLGAALISSLSISLAIWSILSRSFKHEDTNTAIGFMSGFLAAMTMVAAGVMGYLLGYRSGQSRARREVEAVISVHKRKRIPAAMGATDGE